MFSSDFLLGLNSQFISNIDFIQDSQCLPQHIENKYPHNQVIGDPIYAN
ncbi:uncharacterized protein METZ01_LOCUS208379 [marine metagenome]|uniref:Uncharacterized protein n=1 Tax=marine metagenome TaxID=408172 RepID=A0A382EYN3_9ZZZZ